MPSTEVSISATMMPMNDRASPSRRPAKIYGSEAGITIVRTVCSSLRGETALPASSSLRSTSFRSEVGVEDDREEPGDDDDGEAHLEGDSEPEDEHGDEREPRRRVERVHVGLEGELDQARSRHQKPDRDSEDDARGVAGAEALHRVAERGQDVVEERVRERSRLMSLGNEVEYLLPKTCQAPTSNPATESNAQDPDGLSSQERRRRASPVARVRGRASGAVVSLMPAACR